ncbi:MAG: hypothetical protein SNJ78_12355 [Spirochaetales bacterium]
MKKIIILLLSLVFVWAGCNLSSGSGGGGDEGGGGGGGGGTISQQPITSINGTLASYFDVSGSTLDYTFTSGKSIFFGFQNMHPETFSSFKSNSATFNFSLPANLELSNLQTGNEVFGGGLTYSNTSAKFVQGFLAVVSKDPFPESIYSNRQELVILKGKQTSTGSEYLEYVYASAPTIVSGTDAEGNTFDLNLASGWNRVLARYSYSTEKIQYTSETEPPGLTYQGIASAEEKQVFVKATTTPQYFSENELINFDFTARRIVLEYGDDENTQLYAPANQGTFNFVSPIPLSTMLGSADTVFGNGISSNRSDARFTRLRIKVYETSGDPHYTPNDDPIGELFRAKQENDVDIFLTYFYSSIDGVTLSGTTSGSYDENFGGEVGVSLSQGWNIVKGVLDTIDNTITYSIPQPADFERLEWIVYPTTTPE